MSSSFLLFLRFKPNIIYICISSTGLNVKCTSTDSDSARRFYLHMIQLIPPSGSRPFRNTELKKFVSLHVGK